MPLQLTRPGDGYRWEVTASAGNHSSATPPGSRVPLELASGQGCYRRAVADVHLPAGWPEAVAPPGSQDWEASAVEFLLDLVPEYRVYPVMRRHPVVLASIARHTVAGAVEGTRQGYRTARTELGEAVPPHVVDAALLAYRDEGRRLAAALRAAGLLERALRGEPVLARLRRPAGTRPA